MQTSPHCLLTSPHSPDLSFASLLPLGLLLSLSSTYYQDDLPKQKSASVTLQFKVLTRSHNPADRTPLLCPFVWPQVSRASCPPLAQLLLIVQCSVQRIPMEVLNGVPPTDLCHSPYLCCEACHTDRIVFPSASELLLTLSLPSGPLAPVRVLTQMSD